MGWFKSITLSLHGANPQDLTNLNDSIRLIKLKGVNEKRLQDLRDRLLKLVNMYYEFKRKGIATTELVEKIEYIERALGIKLHSMVQREEIEEHDINSAERILDETLSLMESLRSGAERRKRQAA